jgi:hypothetical protein
VVLVYSAKPLVSETAPFLARPLGKTKFEHGSRHISRSRITMGLFPKRPNLSLMVLITETR